MKTDLLEQFKSEKSEHLQMIEYTDKALNRGSAKDSSRDKHDLSISSSKWHNNGEEMGYLVGYDGFYGSSGCSPRTTKRMCSYLKKAINLKMSELMDLAIEMSAKDLESSRKKVESLANEVLQEIK